MPSHLRKLRLQTWAIACSFCARMSFSDRIQVSVYTANASTFWTLLPAISLSVCLPQALWVGPDGNTGFGFVVTACASVEAFVSKPFWKQNWVVLSPVVMLIVLAIISTFYFFYYIFIFTHFSEANYPLTQGFMRFWDEMKLYLKNYTCSHVSFLCCQHCF